MTTIDPAGYSEAGAHLFTWLADKVLGGAKKAFGWGWEQVEWAKAQDRYDARIIQDYGQIRIFGQTTPKSLKDIFTDVYVLDTPTAFRRFDPAALTEHLWNEDRGLSFRHEERRPGEQLLSKGSKFYILGKPGAGKTTFLKHLAVREAQRGGWGPCLGKIPIFVSLKQFGETGKSLFDFIVDEFAVCGFPDAAPFIETLLKSGQALVLFDGLDEVSKTEEHDRRGEVTQMLAQFARQYGDCHIVVTCRIAAVDYTFEPAFTYLEMADFAPDQVEAFVRAWFWDESDKDKGTALAEGMLAALELPEHKGIRDLSRNPLLLTLLCLNYAETQSFPTRRVEIYEEALDALLKKWDSSRRIQRGGLYKNLSLGRKRQMFARIAFDAMARGEVVLAQADLERRLVEYLANVPELPEAIDIDGEVVLREIVAQHGTFAEQARGLYSAAHLTFQEYYAARHIADSAGSDVFDILLSHTGDDKWREVFLLTASLLPDASSFLLRLEGALHRLVDGSPQLGSWLQWIDAHVSGSQAGYKRPAMRVFYAHDLAFEFDRTLDLDLNSEIGALVFLQKGGLEGLLESAQNRRRTLDRVLDLVRQLDLDSARDSDLESRLRDLAAAHGLDLDVALDVARWRLLDDLTLDLAYDLDPTLDRDWNFDVTLVHVLALAALLNLVANYSPDLDIDQSRKKILDLIISLDQSRKDILDLCERQGRPDLCAAIAALAVPDSEPSVEAWQRYAIELEQIIEASGALAHNRQLQVEIDVLEKEQRERGLLTNAEIDALNDYSKATRLFYDCLQLAYTPDRHAFEERIFLPPP